MSEDAGNQSQSVSECSNDSDSDADSDKTTMAAAVTGSDRDKRRQRVLRSCRRDFLYELGVQSQWIYLCFGDNFFTGVYANLTQRFLHTEFQDGGRIPEAVIALRQKTISR